MKKNLPQILHVENSEYLNKSAVLVIEAILESIQRYGGCNLFLTGGVTAAAIYEIISVSKIFRKNIYKINFYFGDERCVEPDNEESNYLNACKTLFDGFSLEKLNVFRIHGESSNMMDEVDRYERQLPKRIDVVLLTVGEDGHIASLFPGNNDTFLSRLIYVNSRNKLPAWRISITPLLLSAAKELIVFVRGRKKGLAIAGALADITNKNKWPVLYAKSGIWVMDDDAFSALKYD